TRTPGKAQVMAEANGEDEAVFGRLPGTPVGRQLAWWVGMIADQGARASPGDRDRFGPALQRELGRLFDPVGLHEAWRRDAARLGAPAGISVERSGDHEITVVLATANDRKFTLAVTVEPEPPHRMLTFNVERRHDFRLEVREATAADALVVADIERRCPIMMGETSTWFDRGAR